MHSRILYRALALAVLASPVAAQADDPRDPAMQTPEAVAHDREMIRRLNRDMLQQVTARDAGYAKGWEDYRLYREGAHPDQLAYRRDLAEYERENARYAESRRRYEQAMANWRRSVAD